MSTRYRLMPRKAYTLGFFLFISGLIFTFRLVPFIEAKQSNTPPDPQALHIQRLDSPAGAEVASTTVEIGSASDSAVPASVNRLIPLSPANQAWITVDSNDAIHEDQSIESPLAVFWQQAQPAFYLLALTLILIFGTWAYPRVVRRKPTRQRAW